MGVGEVVALSGDDILRIIAGGETLEHEFKSDQGPLSSSDMYEEVVALANHEGGVLLIGVEDNGAITGARHRNQNRPNASSCA